MHRIIDEIFGKQESTTKPQWPYFVIMSNDDEYYDNY